MSETAVDRIRRITGLMFLRDPKAADEIDLLAEELHELARKIRKGILNEGPPHSDGGMGDRVQMKLVGPDGRVKKSVDTGASP